jgi:hypothetical protein
LLSDAADKGTALAEAFAEGMREGFIASIDGEAVMCDVNPQQLVLIPHSQLKLDLASGKGAA